MFYRNKYTRYAWLKTLLLSVVSTLVMIQPLINHIEKFVPVHPDKADLLESFFEHKIYKRRAPLLTEGHPCHEKFFIIKGCVNLYYLRQNGTEQTIDFALENWWTSDFTAFQRGTDSQFSIRAIENTEVLAITAARQTELLKQMPELNAYFHLVFQRAYAASQMRFRFLFEFSKEELYQHFMRHFPTFTQRVPQYLLASFLGFTPEYLSEIRKKYLS